MNKICMMLCTKNARGCPRKMHMAAHLRALGRTWGRTRPLHEAAQDAFFTIFSYLSRNETLRQYVLNA